MIYVGRSRSIQNKLINDPKRIMLEIVFKFFSYPYEKINIDNLVSFGDMYLLNRRVGKKLPIYIKRNNRESFTVFEKRDNGNFDISTFILTRMDDQYSNISFLGTTFDVNKNLEE